MKKIYYALVIGFTSLTACQKKEWKEPSRVQMDVDINRAPSSDGKLWFDEGFIRLSQLELVGERSQADDVLYTMSLNDLQVDFGNNAPIELQWELPQGDYTYMQLKILTAANNTLLLNGRYVREQDTLPVRLELNLPMQFDLIATGASMLVDSQIVLEKESTQRLHWQLDPIYWFEAVSSPLWQEAALLEVDNIPTILISKEQNTAIFDKISDRLDDASNMLFYEQ